MSTTTLVYPNVSRDRQTPAIGLIPNLVITSLALLAGTILVIVLSPTWNGYQADLTLVAQTSPDSIPVAVPVPTPPAIVVQPSPSETPSASENRQFSVAVPVPTP